MNIYELLMKAKQSDDKRAEEVKKLLRGYPLIEGVYLMKYKGYDEEYRLIVIGGGNKTGLISNLNRIFDYNAVVFFGEDFTDTSNPFIFCSAEEIRKEVEKGLVYKLTA